MRPVFRFRAAAASAIIATLALAIPLSAQRVPDHLECLLSLPRALP
jgi:hypothetical protein